jgi:hypothetical protein
VSDTPDTTSFPLISTVPDVIPKGYDGEVTIIFNPNQGNKGMQDASACYAHTGLITSASVDDHDWKNVVEDWRQNTTKTKLTKDGNNWKLVISNIYDFYGCSRSTEIEKLAFVFHDGPNGNKEGKTATGADIFVVLKEVEEPETPTAGIGAFSVSATKQVTFSSGNLQYHPANNVWQFAENQTDYIGNANANLAADYDGWLDLFGWSTSTTNFGVSTSESSSDYSGSFVDWGSNKIGNDAPNTWRTLSKDEWEYLLQQRVNAEYLVAIAQVNGINGLIVLPDNWQCPSEINLRLGFSELEINDYSVYQSFSLDQWLKLEEAGAIFLPAAGNRIGVSIFNLQESGNYWSASEDGLYSAYLVSYYSYEAYVWTDGDMRGVGFSVRLVKDVK